MGRRHRPAPGGVITAVGFLAAGIANRSRSYGEKKALVARRRLAITALFRERARLGMSPPTHIYIAEYLLGVSKGRTVEGHLRRLVADGVLRRDGEWGSCRAYVLAAPASTAVVTLPRRSEWPLSADVTAVIQRPGELVFVYGDPTDWDD